MVVVVTPPLVYWCTDNISTSQELPSEGRHLRKENSLRAFATCNKKMLRFRGSCELFHYIVLVETETRHQAIEWKGFSESLGSFYLLGRQFSEHDRRRQRFGCPTGWDMSRDKKIM